MPAENSITRMRVNWQLLLEGFTKMIHQPLRCAFLFVCIVSVFGGMRTVLADDYVWARSNWGVMPGGTTTSKMSNGYGGYYVPRSAVGNNYEGQRFTNPNGFIVPAQQQPQHPYFQTAPAQQPSAVPTTTIVSVPPATQASGPAAVAPPAAPVVTASTQPIANPTVQATQLQQPQQPYRMSRRARRFNR